MPSLQPLLVTGGSGFIGSHLVRRFVRSYESRYLVVNADKLTYAGNPANLADLISRSNYLFRQIDITDSSSLRALFSEFAFLGVIHLAAESHVDRSISAPAEFVTTNVVGTTNLLQCARDTWNGQFEGKCFHHVSTDEVYGSLGDEGSFLESLPPTLLAVPTQHRKPRQITSYEPSTTLMVCQLLSPTAPTTTDPTSFPKNSFQQ